MKMDKKDTRNDIDNAICKICEYLKGREYEMEKYSNLITALAALVEARAEMGEEETY